MNNIAQDIYENVLAFLDALAPFFNFVLNWAATPGFGQDVINIVGFLLLARLGFWILNRSFRKARKVRAQALGRNFPSEIKAAGNKRAGYQCEFSNGLSRCKNRAEHGDHFYPWSKGGASTLRNYVASCSQHNLSKGSKMPSSVEKARIEARRKRYFMPLTDRTAGQWA